MRLFVLWYLGIFLWSHGAAHDHHTNCITEAPSTEELQETESRIAALKMQRSGLGCKQCITIRTYVVVFKCSNGRSSWVNAARVRTQIAVMNEDYEDTAFKFELISTAFVVDDLYCRRFDPSTSSELGQKYRQGDYSTLNIYIGGADMEGSFAFLPRSEGLRGNPNDGIFLGTFTLPGLLNGQIKGHTASHEAGHWFGLLHTFGDGSNPCDPNDKGDYVDDTPATRETNGGCPVGKDSCPNIFGLDPINNYMDYSSDSCRTQFSPGQIDRMFYVWSIYRKNAEACSSGNKLFEFEILTDLNPQDITFDLTSTDGSFNWSMDGLSKNGIDYVLPRARTTILDICIKIKKTYVFTIRDAAGNGLGTGTTIPSYYAIRYDGEQLRRDSKFGAVQTTTFSTAEAPAPGPRPGPLVYCFSEHSTVQVEGKGSVSINQLELGDRVLASGQKYETVYSFGHRNINVEASYVQIQTNGTLVPIELSHDHLIFSNGWVPASAIKVGDCLRKGDETCAMVTRIRAVRGRGAFAPFTTSGTIVVNDIVASTFVTFQESAEYLTIGSLKTHISFQWIAHGFEGGHRLACRYVVDCTHETYTHDGVSHWVDIPNRLARWMLQQDPMSSLVLLVPLLAVITFFSLLEPLQYVVILCTCLFCLNRARKLILRSEVKPR